MPALRSFASSAAMRQRSSALIILRHAPKFGGNVRRLRYPRLLKADTGQLEQIIFHLSLCHACAPPLWSHPILRIAQRAGPKCDAHHILGFSVGETIAPGA